MNKCIKFYLFLLHIILIVVFVYSGLFQKLTNTLLGEERFHKSAYIDFIHSFYSRVDLNTPECATVFIGDSHIQGLAVSDLSQNSVNFGIGMDTAKGVLTRLSGYQSDNRACALVLQVGFNDLFGFSDEEILDNLNKILSVQAPISPVIAIAIFKVDADVGDNGFLILNDALNQRIERINSSYKKLVSQYSSVNFVEVTSLYNQSGNLLPNYHIGDGIHLSAQGYAQWRKTLKVQLDQLTKRPNK